ncbi:gfo/Idh/MocA family oxidoreductase [Paenibacillus sp. LMG 31456]|uniref:Gfo/Idh/MocA family oxidoreductase n=1 Tax=Paenibacillus foliorum TaxID=2654974 RepID=A0A972GVI6_9BACL|nr:Gfo/Idh/MocA family oxidoreductase [Paenibacillus foliorum]NOU96920.1 gfo/Idh/MocA family oxidoreductase [Paenibacillus foliorum]
MTKIRVGVIGAGSISVSHLNSYQNNPNVELVAISDLHVERAQNKAEKYEIPNMYNNYNDLLADPQVEAVSICTWNDTHAEIAIASLKAGKHVLVEKPLSQTVEQALQVEQAVKESGKVLQVGFVRRYANTTRVAKQFIDAGDLGEIYYAKASCLRRLGNPGGWFSDKQRSGGGPLIDLGVHVIDLCWYLMGRPKVKSVSGNVYYKLGNRSNISNLSFYKSSDYNVKNDVEDLASALIRFENGASLMIETSFTLHAKKDEISVKLFGDKGGVEMEPELTFITEKHQTILNSHPQIDQLKFEFTSAFQNEIDHFIACCQSGEKPLSPIEDGIEIMKILCAVYESAQKGSEISF